MAGVTVVPVRFEQQSIILPVTVNGHELQMVLDTGDALGPTFTSADAQTLGLVQGQAIGVEGAGGASTVFQATASITIGSLPFPNEQGAIDGDLEGMSLIGFPWFAAKCSIFEVDLVNSALILIGR